MVRAAPKTATVKTPGAWVAFSEEFPPGPGDRDELVALMKAEWDTQLAWVTEMYRRAKDKQARSGGAICWTGFTDFCRRAELPVPDARQRDYGTRTHPQMTVPDGGYVITNYDWITTEGLSAIRKARIAAWKKQAEAVRAAILYYHHQGYITAQTVTKTLTDMGLKPPVTATRASISVTVGIPELTRGADLIKTDVRNVLLEKFPGATIGRADINVSLRQDIT